VKIKELIKEWEKTASEESAPHKYTLKLPLSVAARISALAEMYPQRSKDEIVIDLLTTALDELLEAFPYEPGDSVTGTDEFGEPIYEDVGLTPQFIELTHKYTQALEKELLNKE
jgi:hypothetical protein